MNVPIPICVKDQWQKDQRDNMPQPSNYDVKDERQIPKDKMPQPNPKVETEAWNDETKQPMLQKPNPNLEAKMPSERMPAVDRCGHHHHQG